MTEQTPEELVEGAIVTVLSHAIRLGKCPSIGMVVEFNMQFKDMDTATGEVTDRTEKHPVMFVVTQDLLDKAIAQINSQKSEYREPKTTLTKLTDAEFPQEAVWNYAKKLQG
jgi:septation ring formation regulator EzrA